MMEWIACSERMPEPFPDNTHDGDLLLYVIDANDPTHKGVYTGSLREKPMQVDPVGENNFWGVKTYGSDWRIWDWPYIWEPIVTHWMPLPNPPAGRGA